MPADTDTYSQSAGTKICVKSGIGKMPPAIDFLVLEAAPRIDYSSRMDSIDKHSCSQFSSNIVLKLQASRWCCGRAVGRV